MNGSRFVSQRKPRWLHVLTICRSEDNLLEKVLRDCNFTDIGLGLQLKDEQGFTPLECARQASRKNNEKTIVVIRITSVLLQFFKSTQNTVA